MELTDQAMEPMVKALLPLKDHTDWLWDFHINGQSRSLKYELHKQPRTARNITNAEYHQDLLDNFTRWQIFFDEPSSGGFFKCAVFEQNGGTHDMGRALGNARNSVTLQSLGNIVRMVTGANALQVSHFLTYQAPVCSTDPLTILTALQLMGHNDNGWDQPQIMVNPNASILTPYGQSNRLLKETWQPTVVQSAASPTDVTNTTEVRTGTAYSGKRWIFYREIMDFLLGNDGCSTEKWQFPYKCGRCSSSRQRTIAHST